MEKKLEKVLVSATFKASTQGALEIIGKWNEFLEETDYIEQTHATIEIHHSKLDVSTPPSEA